MKNHVKTTVIITIIIAIIAGGFFTFIYLYYNYFCLITPKVSKEYIVNKYESNADTFEKVADFIKNYSNSDSVIELDVKKSSYSIWVSINESADSEEVIKDKQVNKNLNILRKRGHLFNITRDSNVIFFMLHTGIHYQQGMMYSIDSKKPSPGQIEITKKEKIGGNWYYYEGK